MTKKPRSTKVVHRSTSHWIACDPRPMISSNGTSCGSPNVSYQISIPLTGAVGMAHVRGALTGRSRCGRGARAIVPRRMSLTFGVHTSLQNTTVDELRSLWHRIEELGFGWISIWDHFYSADFNGYECLEAVASHAALACETTTVRCGSLVYCAGYRH